MPSALALWRSCGGLLFSAASRTADKPIDDYWPRLLALDVAVGGPRCCWASISGFCRPLLALTPLSFSSPFSMEEDPPPSDSGGRGATLTPPAPAKRYGWGSLTLYSYCSTIAVCSFFSINAVCSAFGINAILSAAVFNALLSFFSVNSVASAFSVNSVGSALSSNCLFCLGCAEASFCLGTAFGGSGK